MQSLTSQFFSFLVMVLIGITVGLSFDIYNVAKTAIRPRRIFVFVGDIVFWVFTTINIILLLLVGNWGEIRLYVVIGIISGALIYFRFFRSAVTWILMCIFNAVGALLRLVKKVLRFVRSIVVYPFALMKKIIIIPIGVMGMIYSRISDFGAGLAGRFLFAPIKKRASAVKRSILKYWASLLKR